MLGFSAYHWLVIAAGWAGWGFDVFDAVLFNFVAPNCIPVLLHLHRAHPPAHEAAVFWTGAITSLLLLSWAAGGVLFGWIGDRIGRKRGAVRDHNDLRRSAPRCAPSPPTSGQLILCRTLASLGYRR